MGATRTPKDGILPCSEDKAQSDDLLVMLQSKILEIRAYLNRNDRPSRVKTWLYADEPPRIKHVQKICNAMHDMLAPIEEMGKAGQAAEKTHIRSLMNQIGDLNKLSAGNARELADKFEIELLRMSKPGRLYPLSLAKNTAEKGTARILRKYYEDGLLDPLLTKLAQADSPRWSDRLRRAMRPNRPSPAVEALRLRDLLLESANLEMAGYRKEETERNVRGAYLGKLSIVFSVALFLVSFVYAAVPAIISQASGAPPDQATMIVAAAGPVVNPAEATHTVALSAGQVFNLAQFLRNLVLLLQVCALGAFGSVFSRVIKLSRTASPDAEEQTAARQIATSAPGGGQARSVRGASVGIQALLADQTTFVAQLLIGAASALVIYLAVSANVILPKLDLAKDTGLLTCVAFLAGFSEPFFLGTVERIAGRASAD